MIGNLPGTDASRLHRRRRFRMCVAGLVASGVLLSSCTIGGSDQAASTPSSAPENVDTLPSNMPGPHPSIENMEAGAPELSGKADVPMQEAVDQVIKKYGGMAELAVSDGKQVRRFGHVDPYPAWSSIKVPLAIAALRNDNSDEIQGDVQDAIRASDNDAADALWRSLGGGEASGQAVHQVLADGGNPNTRVQIDAIRPHYSGFGQTQWPVEDSALFAANLPCVSGADFVIEQMGQINSDQRWGLGTIDGAHFKGGWGPDEDGAYLVRQFGFFDGPTGRIAVAIARQCIFDGVSWPCQSVEVSVSSACVVIVVNSLFIRVSLLDDSAVLLCAIAQSHR